MNRLVAHRWLRGRLPGVRVGYLVYFANTRCEQDCRHCFIRPRADDALLTPAELASLGRKLRHLIQLTVTGGEPTLRSDLVDAVAALAGESNARFVSLHTNGFEPPRVERAVRGILGALPGALLSVRLSLDAFGVRHDEIRRRSGSWDRAVDSLDRLVALRRGEPRLRLFVDTCLSAANQGELADLRAFLDSKGEMLDGRELIVLRGSPRDPRATVEAGAIPRALNDFAPVGRGEVALSLPEAARRELYRRKGRDGIDAARGCVAGMHFAVLGADGEVAPCETLWGDRGQANVREQGLDLERVLGTPRGREQRARIARGECAAGCTEECPALASVVFSAGRMWKALLRSRGSVGDSARVVAG